MTTDLDSCGALVPPNYALVQSVRAWQGCAAGAGKSDAPAAPVWATARPTQRGR